MMDFKIITLFVFAFLYPLDSWAYSKFVIQTKNQNLEIQSPAFNDFSSQFIKEIKSGLSVKIIQIVRFNDRRKKINLYQNVFLVRYDLWEEVYLLKVADNEVQQIKDIHNLFAEIKLKSKKNIIFEPKKFKLDRDFFFETLYVVNPISKEKSGIIKKWMAEKFVGPSSQEVGSETNSFIAGMVNTVVQTELDKNIYGADIQIVFKSQKINHRNLEGL